MLNENQKSLILPHQNLSVAQLVEQLTLNQWVVGSNPTGETSKIKHLHDISVGVFVGIIPNTTFCWS